MIPVLTPEEMGAVDRAAPEPVEVLIGRAGAAVARAAIGLLGGTYGRRVVVVAGKGNNGNDGREAARRLRRRGVRVAVIDAGTLDRLPPCDLVIDAAYGTGFRGTYAWPASRRVDGGSGRVPVLAVDIPSGVDGVTGAAGPEVGSGRRHRHLRRPQAGPAARPGAGRAGDVVVADIGLDVAPPASTWSRRPTWPPGGPPDRPPATSGRPRCGWWPAHRGWAAPPLWPVAGPSAAEPATCGCPAPVASGRWRRCSGRGGATRVGRRRLGPRGARRPGSVRRAGHRQRPGHRRCHPRSDPSRAGRAGPGAGAHRGGRRRPHRPGPQAMAWSAPTPSSRPTTASSPDWRADRPAPTG